MRFLVSGFSFQELFGLPQIAWSQKLGSRMFLSTFVSSKCFRHFLWILLSSKAHRPQPHNSRSLVDLTCSLWAALCGWSFLSSSCSTLGFCSAKSLCFCSGLWRCSPWHRWWSWPRPRWCCTSAGRRMARIAPSFPPSARAQRSESTPVRYPAAWA